MDRRIKPWVNKKIVEYIGEEEPTLTEFICQKVMAHSKPEVILNDVAMVISLFSLIRFVSPFSPLPPTRLGRPSPRALRRRSHDSVWALRFRRTTESSQVPVQNSEF